MICLLTCKPGDVTNFSKLSTVGELPLVLFYTSLDADISGTRKYVKKKSAVFFPDFPVLSYEKIEIFVLYSLQPVVSLYCN